MGLRNLSPSTAKLVLDAKHDLGKDSNGHTPRLQALNQDEVLDKQLPQHQVGIGGGGGGILPGSRCSIKDDRASPPRRGRDARGKA